MCIIKYNLEPQETKLQNFKKKIFWSQSYRQCLLQKISLRNEKRISSAIK